MVVNAADIPTSNKVANNKTDPSDSRKIAKALRAGLLTSIHVPLLITEGDRQLFRYWKRLLADLTRIKNRIKDKFLFTGTQIPPEFDNANWSKAFLKWIKIAQLPDPSILFGKNFSMGKRMHLEVFIGYKYQFIDKTETHFDNGAKSYDPVKERSSGVKLGLNFAYSFF